LNIGLIALNEAQKRVNQGFLARVSVSFKKPILPEGVPMR